jgi:hypothetical protein
MTARRTLVASLALLFTLLASSGAHADHRINRAFQGRRPFQLDVHGSLSWYGFGPGGGARFGIPLLHNGFVPSLDNAVYLNFGGDFYLVQDNGCYGVGPTGPCAAREYRFAMGLPVTLHWEFYFSNQWSAFAELGLQVFLPPSLFYQGSVDYTEWKGAWVIGAVGGSLHLNDVVSLTLRVGNPYVSFGMTLDLG